MLMVRVYQAQVKCRNLSHMPIRGFTPFSGSCLSIEASDCEELGGGPWLSNMMVVFETWPTKEEV